MSKASATIDAKSKGRSRITNGRSFVPGIDGRSTWMRRARDVNAQLICDRGGMDVASEAEKLIIRRASVIEAELLRYEKDFAEAGQADANQFDLYLRAAGHQRRLLETVGLERKARDITPDLQSYFAARERT
jgi:hypothetical protein